MDLQKQIHQHAVENAAKFNGKANPGAVLGKLLAIHPELKEDIPKLQEQIKNIIKKVNATPLKKLREEDKKIPKKEKQEKPKVLPPLVNARQAQVIMRFEPSPSGPMHIGHAYALLLNSEYSNMYEGKLILRISDTNPETISEEAYDLIPEDANWITKKNVTEMITQSNNIKRYYEVTESLIKDEHAYICNCKPKKFKKLIDEKEACPCRYTKPDEHIKRWNKMLKNAKEGSMVVRVKTDITHKNPSMRDFPIARIKLAKHPKKGKKYRVWPLLNLSVAVDDHDQGITHAIRAKDHKDNEKKQEWIFNYMSWFMPEHLYIGKINFTDLKLSTTATKELIKKKKYKGWDDIRLPFLQSLKRRGYQPGAILRYALEIGITEHDKTTSINEFFKTLNAFNKDIIDPKSDRYFFVENPKKITIKNAPEQSREIDLHPETKKGGRLFKTKDSFYVSAGDLKGLKDGKLYRLMNCLNFKKSGKGFKFHSREYEKYKGKGEGMLHYLPVEKGLTKAEVLMPDGTVRKGLCEKCVEKLSVGAIIQFERFGFCRLDEKKKDKVVFWYLHR